MSTAAKLSWEEAVTSLLGRPECRQLMLDSYLDRPVQDAVRRYAASSEWRALQRLLPRTPGRALDIGAGNGILSCALARAGWQVVALEPDPSPLVGAEAIRNVAALESLEIQVVQATCESMPLPDASMDLVVARQVFHHAVDLGDFGRQIHRVLKPGGQLITFRDHVVSSPGQLAAFLQRHPLHRHYGGEHAYSLSEYRRALRQAGLRVDRTLLHFDHEINFAPRTVSSLRDELVAAAARIRLGWLARTVLAHDGVLRSILWSASRCSRTPGRHVAFVARRP